MLSQNEFSKAIKLSNMTVFQYSLSEINKLQTELAAVKAEQNHQNKGVMDLQDKYDKVVADRDRLKKMIDSIVTDNYKGNIMTHREIAEKLESDGE